MNTVFNDDSFSIAIQEAALKGIPNFINANDENLHEPTKLIAVAFKANQNLIEALEKNDSIKAQKLVIESFQKNIRILVQKTWTEKEDEEFKDETIYRIDKFCKTLLSSDDKIKYAPVFEECFSILSDVMFLLFGKNVQTPDFLNYAVRIDPDFGLYWYYIDAISKLETFSETKARLSILNGIYFLANF